MHMWKLKSSGRWYQCTTSDVIEFGHILHFCKVFLNINQEL